MARVQQEVQQEVPEEGQRRRGRRVGGGRMAVRGGNEVGGGKLTLPNAFILRSGFLIQLVAEERRRQTSHILAT